MVPLDSYTFDDRYHMQQNHATSGKQLKRTRGDILHILHTFTNVHRLLQTIMAYSRQISILWCRRLYIRLFGNAFLSFGALQCTMILLPALHADVKATFTAISFLLAGLHLVAIADPLFVLHRLQPPQLLRHLHWHFLDFRCHFCSWTPAPLQL